MFGSQSTTPAFGTGPGPGLLGAQRGGSRLVGYAPEPENSSIGTDGAFEKLESISAMPFYKDKSHEELRWEDYHLGDKGGPTFAAQSSGINLSWSTSQPSIFSASSTFSQSSSSLFSTSSSLFAPKASPFSFTGFGPSKSSSPDLFSTTTSTTSLFGPTAPPSTSNSFPSFGPSRFTTQVPGSAPSSATGSYSFSTSPIFAKPDVSSSPFR